MAKRPYYLKLGPPMEMIPLKDFTKLRETFGNELYFPDVWRIIGPTVEANMRGRRPADLWELFCICYLQGLENASSAIWERKIGLE
ncbi:MAG: hypothetical protein ACR2QF_09355 [Geminicoccaceae bacterium]